MHIVYRLAAGAGFNLRFKAPTRTISEYYFLHWLVMNALRILCFGLLLSACAKHSDEALLGTLEWDRISIPAESSETVLRWAVKEGDAVKAGQLLLVLDDRRVQAKLSHAQAQLAQQEARLAELTNGSRIEDLDAARAELSSSLALQLEARRQYDRQAELAAKQLVARSALDNAKASRDRASASVSSAQARLQALNAGPRREQIAQAEAGVRAAQASVQELQVSLSKLSVHAPRAGRIDALPFKPGDQPSAGASVASVLVGDAPYARVYVPASQRVGVLAGQKYRVHVQGDAREWKAHVQHIAREAAFTPYFALTGDDASRLVYRAELVFDEADSARLPAGLSVQANPDAR